MKPWQPIQILNGKGANSIQTEMLGQISQIKSLIKYYKILKAHLIYLPAGRQVG